MPPDPSEPFSFRNQLQISSAIKNYAWKKCRNNAPPPFFFSISRYATASSAAVERLFSIGKDILKPTRCGLSDTHFEMLSFLEGN